MTSSPSAIQQDTASDVLFSSASASVRFALSCLEPAGPYVRSGRSPRDATSQPLRATSTFVDPEGRIMHWHDFGDLEGPGWAANAIGGALLLYRWGRYIGSDEICRQALRLADHVLDDGFVASDGFIWPYFDLAEACFCLNYAHTNDWLCPGSLALIGVQMWDLAAELGETPRAARLRAAASELAAWLADHVTLLPNGWVPRRITRAGAAYPLTPEGGSDPIFDHSADGLFLLALWTRLGDAERAVPLTEAFVKAGGFWGSINHDTYDDHENVAYAVAFRVLRSAADTFSRPEWWEFAYDVALPAMRRFRMNENHHGVFTQGLFWMEASWDTAYLWENAEVAQAHLEAWQERDDTEARDIALAILGAMAHHHYGDQGFLTEGIDWNNHVSQRHHIDFAYYGAIRYTEPLLNNLHLVGPTLTYLQATNVRPSDEALGGATVLARLADRAPVSQEVRDLEAQPAHLWLRLFHPALATDESVDAAVAFAQEAGMDGVLLFEASYDTDPALLTLEVLEERFARLKAVVPQFRAAGLQVHINVMITMGHVDSGGGQPEAFDFQMLVDATGATSRSTACPLDPNFLAYVEQIYRWAASCEADAVWVDDDVRFLGHDVAEMTCFCPHHLAEMAARTGQSWTRETLVAALQDDATPHIRQTWFALQAAAMDDLARRIERAVHEVTPAQPIGLMTVGTTVHNAEGRHTDSLLRVLSGDVTPPMLRPGSGFWHDWTPAAVLNKTEDVARQTAYLGKDVRVVAEIENHPYSPAQKSHRMLALEIALNILAGVHDLSLNIVSGTMPFRRSEVDDAEFLQAQRPFLLALREACAGKRRLGIGVEAAEDAIRRMPLAGHSLMTWVAPRPWEIALSRQGLPVGHPYDAPHLLTAECVWTDRYALGSMLQEGVVLTPGAARGLLAQRMGTAWGIQAVRPAPRDVNEVFTTDTLNGNYADTCLPVRHYAADLGPHTFELVPSAAVRALSQWVDLKGEVQGPGAMAVELENGRRVGLLPFEITTVTPALLHPARRDQWAALFAWVGQVPLPVYVTEGPNIVPQVLVSRDRSDVVVVWVNLAADETVATVTAPLLDSATRIERLVEDGRWQQVNQPTQVRVPPWSLVVLRAHLDAHAR